MPRNAFTLLGKDRLRRCWWCGSDEEYVRYHDFEWGIPVDDDHRLFEKISLEGFQSGLSWLTILKKRPAFREAFLDFDPHRVARFNRRNVNQLLKDPGIVRHRGKIESTINNAKQAVDLIHEFGSLVAYFRQFEPNHRRTLQRRKDVPSKSAESEAMSRDLKSRGWTFVGPTTCYAFMQAMGLVTDHAEHCYLHELVESLQVLRQMDS